MHPIDDFDPEQGLPSHAPALVQDLDLGALLDAMAGEDEALYAVARRALLCGVADPGVILYRQSVLADCLGHPAAVREMYAIAAAGTTGHRRIFGYTPTAVLDASVRTLTALLPLLRGLREIAERSQEGFRSPGFVRLFATLRAELDEGYLQGLEAHLRSLRFPQGVLLSARLGPGNGGTDYTVRLPRPQGWRDRLALWGGAGHTLRVNLRDDDAAASLARIRGRAVNAVANALAQSADNVLGFFGTLRTELGFYTACLNLHDRLSGRGKPVCFPVPVASGEAGLSASGLYDPCLALRSTRQVVGNDIAGQGKRLVMITGANGGGKSTFLRSVGLAQLMMQCGMFVAAESLQAGVSNGVFTHFRREEDAGMEEGKLGEELSRMSEIVNDITRGCLLLCNESVASTNEREGSEIARQIVRALTDAGIRVFYVTHLFDLAQSLYSQGAPDALFLRAERGRDGSRPYLLCEAAPLPTGFGDDLYRQVFGPAGDAGPVPRTGPGP